MNNAVKQPNPWFAMWLKPRETIQSIVNRNPTHLVIPLAIAVGISKSLDRASIKSLGDSFELPTLLAFCVVAGILFGIAGLYIFSYLLKITGNWFGGQSNLVNIRSALAWSSVPTVWALLLWVPQLIIFGKDLFTSSAPRIAEFPYVYFGFVTIESLIAIWGLVVFCKALGQVQKFSVWLALVSVVLSMLTITLPLLLLTYLLVSI